jgi:phosphocarrier protein
MAKRQTQSVEVTIENQLGFHVRPVQRFATLAQMFDSDVEVELRGRSVPGKSVMNLVSLGGRCGDRMKISARGPDAGQCVGVLGFLARNRFFVEDHLNVEERPNRHMERLARIAACFESDVRVVLDGQAADAKDARSLAALGLTPTSSPELQIEGEDARQAEAVLKNLVESCFYVEDKMAERARKVS